MTKRTISREEWWPVLELRDPDEDAIEISDALIARYEAALSEWREVQTELRALAPPYEP